MIIHVHHCHPSASNTKAYVGNRLKERAAQVFDLMKSLQTKPSKKTKNNLLLTRLPTSHYIYIHVIKQYQNLLDVSHTNSPFKQT